MDELDNEDGNISDLADEDLDEELGLPPVLANLDSAGKKELLLFKRAHNEVLYLTSNSLC